jgi:hypothetical protein
MGHLIVPPEKLVSSVFGSWNINLVVSSTRPFHSLLLPTSLGSCPYPARPGQARHARRLDSNALSVLPGIEKRWPGARDQLCRSCGNQLQSALPPHPRSLRLSNPVTLLNSLLSFTVTVPALPHDTAVGLVGIATTLSYRFRLSPEDLPAPPPSWSTPRSPNQLRNRLRILHGLQ